MWKIKFYYALGHRQCTSCVNWSLGSLSAGGNLLRKPVTLLKKSAKGAKSTTGDFEGEKANIGLLSFGTKIWERALESGELEKALNGRGNNDE